MAQILTYKEIVNKHFKLPVLNKILVFANTASVVLGPDTMACFLIQKIGNW